MQHGADSHPDREVAHLGLCEPGNERGNLTVKRGL